MSDNTPRTIEHDTAGPAVLVLSLPTATRVIVGTDPATTTAVVSLTPATGDDDARATIDSATISAEGRRLRITAIHTLAPLPSSVPGVNIQGGTVIAGNIGGSGNIGMVSGTINGSHRTGRITGTGALVAHASVPTGSTVRIIADDAEVAISGQLGSVEVDTRGHVAIDLTGSAS
ncbi:hypothetical protein A5789_09220 [Nocardia sp. 852002-51101_SCH5132738]|uniref:hypothetical protein n=1 Tax=Nocardia sp. 852002-51101_SCH5132738 TaxID=1834095 RepID=UPI0007E98D47|nr:hypothetical protein [Nocardia sp. 852002-51101_SCH5132738]OBA44461.1 hypothetical protein A5789_09220 [Nocardia sp. 852002-51101_SCH5132738]